MSDDDDDLYPDLSDAEIERIDRLWREKVGLYPELPWTEEDEAAADRALAKQIAEGDDGGPHMTAEEAEAWGQRIRRESAWVKRIYLMSEGLMTEDDDSHEASEGSGESEGEP